MKRDESIRKIIDLLAKEGAKKIAIFGSYARREEKESSDIDILVEFSGKKSLLDLVRIEQEISDAIKKKVDLLTEKSISPYLIDKIKKEMVVVYGQKG